MIAFLIFMAVINFIFILMTKSVQNDILKHINLKEKIEKIEKNKTTKTIKREEKKAPVPENFIG
jgi:hypothetical protein